MLDLLSYESFVDFEDSEDFQKIRDDHGLQSIVHPSDVIIIKGDTRKLKDLHGAVARDDKDLFKHQWPEKGKRDSMKDIAAAENTIKYYAAWLTNNEDVSFRIPHEDDLDFTVKEERPHTLSLRLEKEKKKLVKLLRENIPEHYAQPAAAEEAVGTLEMAARRAMGWVEKIGNTLSPGRFLG